MRELEIYLILEMEGAILAESLHRLDGSLPPDSKKHFWMKFESSKEGKLSLKISAYNIELDKTLRGNSEHYSVSNLQG